MNISLCLQSNFLNRHKFIRLTLVFVTFGTKWSGFVHNLAGCCLFSPEYVLNWSILNKNSKQRPFILSIELLELLINCKANRPNLISSLPNLFICAGGILFAANRTLFVCSGLWPAFDALRSAASRFCSTIAPSAIDNANRFRAPFELSNFN